VAVVALIVSAAGVLGLTGFAAVRNRRALGEYARRVVRRVTRSS